MTRYLSTNIWSKSSTATSYIKNGVTFGALSNPFGSGAYEVNVNSPLIWVGF